MWAFVFTLTPWGWVSFSDLTLKGASVFLSSYAGWGEVSMALKALVAVASRRGHGTSASSRNQPCHTPGHTEPS